MCACDGLMRGWLRCYKASSIRSTQFGELLPPVREASRHLELASSSRCLQDRLYRAAHCPRRLFPMPRVCLLGVSKSSTSKKKSEQNLQGLRFACCVFRFHLRARCESGLVVWISNPCDGAHLCSPEICLQVAFGLCQRSLLADCRLVLTL
jgi:hypothetical protein